MVHSLRAFASPFLIVWTVSAHAKDFTTNNLEFRGAPAWLTQSRIERVTDRMQDKLEWQVRRVPVTYYEDPEGYARAQSLGPMADAVTIFRGDRAEVHIGPSVRNDDFDAVLGHELVHVILGQKYKGAIPKWFEEGLANHYAKRGRIDYAWLSRQTFPADVQELAHPFQGSAAMIGYRYKASQALAEMLDKKCGLENLIRLSVQRKMEDYVKSYCEIKDLNAAFRDWVKKRSTRQ